AAPVKTSFEVEDFSHLRLKALVIDDVKINCDILVKTLQKLGVSSKQAENGLEALGVLTDFLPDIIFVDIQMPGLSGLQLVNSLENRPMVIFVTAYQQYALDGFNLDVIDYVLKPINFERFLKASHKSLDYYKSKLVLNKPAEAPKLEFIFIHADYSLMKIMLEDILYIEGLKDYIKIHLRTQKFPVVCRMTMKSIEEKLPSTDFIRVHKSFIVSLSKMESIRSQKIKIGENHIPISESYSEHFYQIIGYQKQ
ncbi:MAG: hypothetical protein RIR57_994, partial [Bacteroidota bacterium]